MIQEHAVKMYLLIGKTRFFCTVNYYNRDNLVYKHKVVQAILNLSKNEVIHRKKAIVDSRFLTGITVQLYFSVVG